MNLSTRHQLEQLDDRQLIGRFHRDKDERAFSLLVERHGPMVLRVCLKTIQNQQDAEEAYQAVFMVLARKAGKVGWQKCLANWLYGVALRLSLNVNKEKKNRPQSFELKSELAMELADSKNQEAGFSAEAERTLYEEIERLPNKLRGPILLCSLEGQTRQQAAKALGIKETTLNGRMERARELLRTRMLKREIVLPVAVLSGGLIPTVAEAGFSTSLVFSPAAVASNLTAGTTVSGQLGATAVHLAQGELATMLMMTKLKVMAVTVAVLMTVGTGSLLIPQTGKGDNSEKKQVGESEQGVPRQLLGEWRVVSIQEGDEIATEEMLSAAGYRLTVSASELTMFVKGKIRQKQTYQLDQSRQPMEMDLISQIPIRIKGERFKAIIDVQGDELKYCLNEEPTGDRPTEFVAGKEASDHFLLIAKRIKPEADVVKQLKGEWQVVSVTDGGRVRDLDAGEKNQFVFTDKTITLYAKGRPKTNLLKIDVNQNPMWMDLELPDGKLLKGIFELTDDEFTFCLNEVPGEPRPNKFESVGGSPNDLLMIARRIGPDAEVKSQLLGEWQIVSALDGGKVREVDADRPNQFVFHDKILKISTTEVVEGKEYIRHTSGTYTLDLRQKPHALDLDLGEGNVLKAIFEVSEDEFKICLNEHPGATRPDKFESKSGSPNDLLITATRITTKK